MSDDKTKPENPASQPSLNRFVRRLRGSGLAAGAIGTALAKIPAAWIPVVVGADIVTTGGVVISAIGGLAVLSSYSAETVGILSGAVRKTLVSIFVGTEEFELRVLSIQDLGEI